MVALTLAYLYLTYRLVRAGLSPIKTVKSFIAEERYEMGVLLASFGLVNFVEIPVILFDSSDTGNYSTVFAVPLAFTTGVTAVNYAPGS